MYKYLGISGFACWLFLCFLQVYVLRSIASLVRQVMACALLPIGRISNNRRKET